jgi:DNA polymerase-3 subunit delta'
MTSLLSHSVPGENASSIARLVDFAQGSIGRAIDIAALDLAPLESEAQAILREGDPDNMRRSKLAGALGLLAADAAIIVVETICRLAERQPA